GIAAVSRLNKQAIVIGAGIGGLAAAIALRKVGWDVTVYESNPDVREAGAGLLIGRNAMQALQRLGVARDVAAFTNTLTALDILAADGTLLSRTASRPATGADLPDNVTILR